MGRPIWRTASDANALFLGNQQDRRAICCHIFND